MNKDEHRGDWIQTYTGRKFFPVAPRAEDIEILDVAHALSMLCRYTGHTKQFYSVAQHSVLVSRIVPPQDAAWGLLHDASEAYLCDVARPIKPYLQNYRLLEQRLMVQVAGRFDLTYAEPDSIPEADLVMLATERRDLMRPPPEPWHCIENVEPLPEAIVPLCPVASKELFLARFRELFPDWPNIVDSGW